jgi:DNA repair exonuclease SbcCD nuclease subunit
MSTKISINEDMIVTKDNQLDFDYKGSDGLVIKYGKNSKTLEFKPYSSRSKDFGGYEVISLFSTSSLKGKHRQEIFTPILKALKGKNDVRVNKGKFILWLKQAAKIYGKYIDAQYKPDAILTIRSSSKLNNIFTKALSGHLKHSIVIPDAISKAPISSIQISKDATEQQRKVLRKFLDQSIKNNLMEIKKLHVSLRPLLKGILSLEDIGYGIEGKTIVIIDDYLSTRTTMAQAIHSVAQYNPKEIIGVTLFKA